MVSLPELDSEIGVLRFLKWKTRLLALDVIRASGRAYINSIDDVPEPESLDPEVSSHLESQDDAAVVRLALSKLNPRHREVLIASMYEEKSTEQIAKQVGLSENATRQLIFRARSAFKKALIGDVDTTGMSAGAILSVAARKAAQESKKIGASAMALIALVVMSLVAFPSLTGNRQADNLAGGTIESSPSQSQQDPSGTADQSGQGTATDTDASNDAEGAAEGAAADAAMDADGLAADANQAAARVAAPAPARSPSASPTPTEDPFSDQSLRSIFDSKTSTSLFALDEKLVVFADNGVSASFIFNPTAEEPFKDVFAEFEIGEAIFAAYPNSSEWLSATDPQGQERFVYFGALNYVYDEKGKIWSKSDLAKATLRIEVILEKGSLKVEQVLLNVLSKG
jgi:RNA polymerase sigma-70 factor (ECF subfamily)